MLKKIIIISLFVLFLTGCRHEALTKNSFDEKMKEEGFTIHDATDQFDIKIVESVSVANSKNSSYQIEFVVFKDEESAKDAFVINKEDFQEIRSVGNIDSSLSDNNFSMYSLSTKDTYFYISRVKNTLIFVDIDGSYKTKVKKILKNLKY